MSETTETEHPTRQDRIVAGVIALVWVILSAVGSLGSGGTASINVGALAGSLFAAAIIYGVLVNTIKWYHSR